MVSLKILLNLSFSWEASVAEKPLYGKKNLPMDMSTLIMVKSVTALEKVLAKMSLNYQTRLPWLVT